jgi:sec-independent protein translocase protein TatA
MPSIGPLELGIILLIILIVFGPKRLPGLGRQLGSGMREFKESITGKDRDDDDDEDDDRDAFGQPAARKERERRDLPPAEAEVVPRSAAGGEPRSEPEVVSGEVHRDDRPASRADS